VVRSKIFFTHVSKTAGVSLGAFLSSLFRPDEICPAPSTGVWAYSPPDVSQYRLFMGHFCHDFIDGFQGTKSKLIMLRDPCARLVSLYDFWRSFSWEFILTALPPLPTNGPAVAKSCSFAKFLTTENVFVQQHVVNPVSRQLLGAEFDAISADEERVVALSIRRLETFDWIGITENFQTSVRMLAALLRSPEPATSIHMNRTYDKDSLGTYRGLVARTEPTPDETELMRDVTRIDRIVYRHALELFCQRSMG
jgi:hypothetical protein